MLTDIQLLSAMKAGDEAGLNHLYASFFHALCAFGSRYVKEADVVADIVQEVFIKIWDKRRNFDNIYTVRSFMYVSVRNACLNYNRNNARIHKISLSDILSENLVEDESCWMIEEEVHRRIKNEIDNLPEAMRKVINMTLLDISVSEIADILCLSENTIRNQRVRAREILRSKLGDKMFLLFFF